MRLRFFSPGDEAETGYWLGQMAAIDEFWRQFRRVSGQAEHTWLTALRTSLAAIEPGLGLEVRHEAEGARTLYVLPLTRGCCVPFAQALVDRAPKIWPWSFALSRPALPVQTALSLVHKDFELDLQRARARVGVSRGHLLEVVLGSHLFGGNEDELALDAADRLVNAILGDELYEAWVDVVHVVNAPRPSSLRVVGQEDTTLGLSLAELLPAVVAARRGILGALPEAPCHAYCESADWVMFEIGELRTPELAPDAAQSALPGRADEPPQADLQVTATTYPEMLRCFLSGSPFSSSRFSRSGEQFCYLRLSLPGGTLDERVAQRVAIEEVLDYSLVPGRLGCVIGSGIGSRYMYIHLSLQQVEVAIPIVTRRAREAGALKESWLLFCDTVFADEWVGVWEDSPAPHWPSTHSSAFLDAYN